MRSDSLREIVGNQPWRNHAGLVLLLGLSPLLAVSNSVVNALGLGLATLIVLSTSALLVSLFRHQFNPTIRVLVFMLLLAALSTCVELAMQAYAFQLYQRLGLFVPLIVANSLLLDRAENFASKRAPLSALLDALVMGTSFMLLLLVMGAIRELLGTGALLANMQQLLPFAAGWKLQAFSANSPFLLAILPPGAFLTLGMLIALKNVIDKHVTQSKRATAIEAIATGSKRVRVTGKI